MEQQDFTPIGGNYIQDVAYSLRQIIHQASELLEKFDENGQLIVSAITESNSNVVDAINQQETTVEVTTYSVANQQTLFVYNPLPIVTPKPNQTVVYKNVTITPEPKVVDVTKITAYERVCGPYHPISSDYVYCMDCVDRWLAAHSEGFQIKDLTQAGTGCTTKRPKRCCKPNGMPF